MRAGMMHTWSLQVWEFLKGQRGFATPWCLYPMHATYAHCMHEAHLMPAGAGAT